MCQKRFAKDSGSGLAFVLLEEGPEHDCSVHVFHPHPSLLMLWVGGEICLAHPHRQTDSVERKERWHQTQDGRTGSHAQLCMGRGICFLPTSAWAAGCPSSGPTILLACSFK